MATNIPKSTQQVLDKNTVIEGTFKGDLQGNADTATELQNNFSVTLTGDATGSFTTHGNSTQMAVVVNRSRTAENADHAKTADSVAHASTADRATHADTAGHASTSAQSTTATTADTADHALTSHRADFADKATHADFAKHADEADTTKQAQHADFADIAKEAQALAIDAKVPTADYATKAGVAEIAQYDCDGLSIKDYYAKKTDIPNDCLRKEEADALYIQRREKLLQAVVHGMASGVGHVSGNTLMIDITSLDITDTGLSLYDKIEFLDTVEIPSDKALDTTRIYVTKDNHLHLYNHVSAKYEEISADLAPSVRDELDEAIAKLKTAVNTVDNQEIRGTKTFMEVVYGGIPSMTADNDKALATVHNVLDVQADLEAQIKDLDRRVGMQEEGDIVFALEDYSVTANQANMMAGVRYLALLTEDKEYIQLNKDTNLPTDPSKVPFYYRYYVKAKNGQVSWSDYRISADLSDYAKLAGATFTGAVRVPDLEGDVNTIKDDRIINTKQVHTLLDNINQDITDKDTAVNEKLEALKKRVNVAEPKIDLLNTRVTSVEQTLVDHAIKIDANTKSITAHTARLDAVELKANDNATRLTTVEQKVATHDTTIAEQGIKVTDAVNRIGVLEPKVSDLENKATDLEGKVTIVEQTVAGQNNKLTEVETKVQSHGARLDAVEPKVSTLETKVTKIELNVANQDLKTDALEVKVTTAEGDIAKLKDEVPKMMPKKGGAFEGAVTIPNQILNNISADSIINKNDTQSLIDASIGKIVDGTVPLPETGNLMPKSGGKFNGNIYVADQANIDATSTETILNRTDTQKLITKALETYSPPIELDRYMLKTGGKFEGRITIDNHDDLNNADGTTILNKADTATLIADAIGGQGDVDTSVFMLKTGGTFTGAVSWATDPTDDNHLSRKAYIDAQIHEVKGLIGQQGQVDLTSLMPKAGGDFTGKVTVPNHDDVNTASDNSVLNKADTSTLISEAVKNVQPTDVSMLMPKSGGKFTGNVSVDNQADLSATNDDVILNKADTNSLINDAINKIAETDTSKLMPRKGGKFEGNIKVNNQEDLNNIDETVIVNKHDVKSLINIGIRGAIDDGTIPQGGGSLGGNYVVKTPYARSPRDTVTLTGTPLLESDPFESMVEGRGYGWREFEVALESDASFSKPIFKKEEAGVNPSVKITPSLDPDTGYIWRCRDRNSYKFYSAWSDTATFKTSSDIPKRNLPNISIEGFPDNITGSPLLSCSHPESTPPVGNDRWFATDWKIEAQNGDIVWSLLDAKDDNSSRVQVPADTLQKDTDYVFKARMRGELSYWSDWAEKPFKTAKVFPTVTTPTITIEGAPNSVNEQPKLTSSSFGVTQGSDSLECVDWIILDAETQSEVWSSKNDKTNKYWIKVPKGELEVGKSYKVKLRHKGVLFGWSEFAEAEFATVQSFYSLETPTITLNYPLEAVGKYFTAKGSPFKITNGSGSHDKSEWFIYKADDLDKPLQKWETTSALTSVNGFGKDYFEPSTEYVLKVRYHDATNDIWSDLGSVEYTTASLSPDICPNVYTDGVHFKCKSQRSAFNFFQRGSYNPSSDFFEVIINGEMTTQRYDYLTVKEGDEVLIRVIPGQTAKFSVFSTYNKDSNRQQDGWEVLVQILSPLPTMWENDSTKETNFTKLFYQNSSLNSICNNLFSNNTQAIYFASTFENCSNLTSIGDEVFANCKEARYFEKCFQYTARASSIRGLFKGCHKAENFEQCFKSSGIRYVFQDVFKGCFSAKNFKNVFASCLKLKSVSSDFSDCHQAETFESAFYRCGLLEIIPDNLFKNCGSVKSYRQCFDGCSSLYDIGNMELDCKDLSLMFQLCSSLKDIRGLSVSSYADASYMFQRSGVTEVDLTKFRWVKNCDSMFKDCTSLITVTGHIDSPSDITSMFDGCTKLQSIETTPIVSWPSDVSYFLRGALGGYVIKIERSNITSATDFARNNDNIGTTVIVPRGSTTYSTFRNSSYANVNIIEV